MAAKLDKNKVRIGITPTSWWNDDFLSIDIGIPFEQCISEMALAGYQGCSVGHKFPTDTSVLKTALQLRCLRVSEPWVSTYFTNKGMVDQTFATFHQQLAFIKTMGGSDMVVAEFGGAVNPLPVAIFANRPEFTDAQWTALVDGLHQLGRIANEGGMRLCYHPHMGTGVMIERDVDRLMQTTDPRLVHLLLDTGHLKFAGADPLAVARRYKERIAHVHLKDLRPGMAELVERDGLSFKDAIEIGVFTVPGGGIIDFKPIFSALAEADYEGWLIVEAEQDPAKAHPLTYAKKGRAYLRDVLGF